MAFYENVFIARQDLSTQQVDALVQSFTELVAANGGEVKKTESWGLRSLTYRIKKNRKGHYTLLCVDGPAAAIEELERNQRLSEDVLRYMSVRVEAIEEGPSAMLQSRARDERGGRRGDGFRPEGGGGFRGNRGDRPERGGDEGGLAL